MTFAYVEMDENGNTVQRVRKTGTTTIEITPISKWSDIIPDSVLGGLDQRLIVMNAQIQAMNDYLDVIDSNKVDNLVYNECEDTLQLSANGVGVGNKVSVKDMLDDGIPVVDLDSVSGDTEHDNGCNCGNCGCEDNVVEFGYSSDNIDEPEESTDDDNVVEF